MFDNDQNAPGSGFGEEAPDASLRDTQEQRRVSDTQQESEESEKQREFIDKLQDCDRNAEQAGREAYRKLIAGFMMGIGKRIGEKIWDIATGSFGS